MPPTPEASGLPTPSDGASEYELTAVAPIRFKVACPECRAGFELPGDAFLLAIGASRRTTTYSFGCPRCAASVRKPAGRRIVELLTQGGVRTLRLHSANGAADRSEGPDGPGGGQG